MSEIPNPGIAEFKGIERIAEYDRTGNSIYLDPQVFSEIRPYRPRVRGVTYEVNASISGVLRESPIVEWIQANPEGFMSHAGRDVHIRRALATIDDLTVSLQTGDQDSQDLYMQSLAVGEKISELDILARPYIPKSLSTPEPEDEMAESPISTEVILPSIQMKRNFDWKSALIKLFSKLPEGATIPIKPIKTPNIPRIPIRTPQAPQERIDDSASRKRRRVREIDDSDLPSRSFLLDDFYIAGREKLTNPRGRGNTVVRVKNSRRPIATNGFVVTKVYNRYDPESGLMTTDSEKTRIRYYDIVHIDSTSISANIGVIDPMKFKTIGIPFYVTDTDNRTFEPDIKDKLINLQIVGKDGVIVEKYDLVEYVDVDGLGNLSLSLEDMPDEVRRKLTGQSLTINAFYKTGFNERTKVHQSELLGPFSEDEDFRLNLYPEDIANLIRRLREVIKDGSERDPFSILTQYLSVWALEYDIKDAAISKDDPVSFNQTERVLERKLASCEGANIALGQLMRHLIKPGEGIAFVTGYQLGTGGTADDMSGHMMVMYVDKKGNKTYLDATPWLPEQRKRVENERRAAVRAKEVWYRSTKYLRENPNFLKEFRSLKERARNATTRLSDSWNIGDLTYELEQELRDFGIYIAKFKQEPAVYFEEPKLIVPQPDPNDPKGAERTRERIGLIPVIRKHFKVPERMKAFWPESYDYIDGTLEIKIPNYYRDFYRGFYYSKPKDPSAYYMGDSPASSEARARRDLLYNGRIQRKTISAMTRVLEASTYASAQNIQAYETLATLVEAEYERQKRALIACFESIPGGLGQDLDNFWNQMPFIRLIDSPFPHLTDFFTRSIDSSSLGHLVTSSGNIEEDFNLRISEWRTEMDKRIASFYEFIQYAPRKSKSPTVVEVPSTFLWRQMKDVRPTEPEERPDIVDPLGTFALLARHMDDYKYPHTRINR